MYRLRKIRKQLPYILVIPVLLISLISTIISARLVEAAAPAQKQYSLTVLGGSSEKTHDSNGKAILQPKTKGKFKTFTFDSSVNGRVASLPKDTIIFLHFSKGQYKTAVAPAKGIVETPPGEYHLPVGVSGLFKVVGEGSATITVSGSSFDSNFMASAYAPTWSGYAKEGNPGDFHQVSSRWTVPAVTCGSGSAKSVAWIGLDGSDTTDEGLIQVGTGSSCNSDNTPSYYAWWEIVPAPATILTCAVSPGNNISAEIRQQAPTIFSITIINLTTGTDCSPPDQFYDGPLDSAEWIMERPLVLNFWNNWTPSTLANFGAVEFVENLQNDSNPFHNHATESIIMSTADSSQSTILASPSAPGNQNDAFNVSYCNVSGGCGTSLHSPWTHVSPSNISSHNEIRDMTTDGSTVWAAGWEQPAVPGKLGVVHRYTDGAWTKFNTPAVSSGSNHWLYGVAGGDLGEVWAVGNYAGNKTQTLAYKWNGAIWQGVPSDNPGGSNRVNDLRDVSVDKTNTAWAVGHYLTSTNRLPLLEKWNGIRFAHHPLSLPAGLTNAGLSAIGFSSPTNGWAVGGGSSSTPGPLFYRYDGSIWTPTLGSIPGGALSKLSVVSDNVAWALGSKNINNQPTSSPLIMRFSNGSWEEVPGLASYPGCITLQDISAVSSSDVWVAGYYCENNKVKAFTMHYDGSGWARIPTPTPSTGSYTTLHSILANPSAKWTGGSTNTTNVQNNAYPYLLRAN